MAEVATEVVVGSETESITHLDEDFQIACEVPARAKAIGGGTPRCQDDAAEWVAWRAACCPQSPKYLLICDLCKRTYQNWIANHASITCGDCGEQTGGPIAYTPLNKGRT